MIMKSALLTQSITKFTSKLNSANWHLLRLMAINNTNITEETIILRLIEIYAWRDKQIVFDKK